MRHIFSTRNLILLLCFLLASGCAATETTTKPDTAAPAPKVDGGAGTETMTKPAATPTPKPVILYVVSHRVNLRECPSAKCKVAAVLKLGDEVIKLGQRKDWINVRVKTTNREGWVASTLVGKTANKKKPASKITEQSPPRGKDKQGSSELHEEFAP
jgi:SH3-like domain-containing protein